MIEKSIYLEVRKELQAGFETCKGDFYFNKEGQLTYKTEAKKFTFINNYRNSFDLVITEEGISAVTLPSNIWWDWSERHVIWAAGVI